MNVIEIKKQSFDIQTELGIEEISFDFEYVTKEGDCWGTKILSIWYRTKRDIIENRSSRSLDTSTPDIDCLGDINAVFQFLEAFDFESEIKAHLEMMKIESAELSADIERGA